MIDDRLLLAADTAVYAVPTNVELEEDVPRIVGKMEEIVLVGVDEARGAL